MSVSLLGYDTGAGRGGGGLGKAFGLAPNPIHWLISESAAHTASASASHRGSGEVRRQDQRATDHRTASSNFAQDHTLVGLYHTQHQHQTGEGVVEAHSHASKKSLELYFDQIIVTP